MNLFLFLLQGNCAGNIGDFFFHFNYFEAHFENEVEENHDGDVEQEINAGTGKA
jgi:hypothetical protein